MTLIVVEDHRLFKIISSGFVYLCPIMMLSKFPIFPFTKITKPS